jgi:hypothetical protein
VIGALLMISIVVMGLSTLFWQNKQMYSCQEVVQMKIDDDFVRMSESIKITGVRVDGSNLNVTVLNKGPLPAHLVSLYVINYSNGIPQWQKYFPLNNYSDPGASLCGIGLSLNIAFQEDGIYGINIATERGNIASFVYGLDIKPVEKAQPLSFSFDERSFNYTTTTGDPKWRTTPRPAWELQGSSPGTHDILFWLKCTNNGAKDVQLSQYSYFFIKQPFPSPDGRHSYEYEHYFLIVDNRSTSTPSGGVIAYSDLSQVIHANHTDYETGTTQIVKFGATGRYAIGGTLLKDWPAPVTSGWNQQTYGSTNPAFCHQYITHIVVYWKYVGDNQLYSQYIPYALIWTD